MSAAIATLTFIRTVGSIYSTYRLAKAALNRLQHGTEIDYLDVVGHHTSRGGQLRVVGIKELRFTINTQTIPESPRGKFLAEFQVLLKRERRSLLEGERALQLPVLCLLKLSCSHIGRHG